MATRSAPSIEGRHRAAVTRIELIVNIFMTLDGVMQAPGGPGEDPSGFEHGGWAFGYWDDMPLGRPIRARRC